MTRTLDFHRVLRTRFIWVNHATEFYGSQRSQQFSDYDNSILASTFQVGVKVVLHHQEDECMKFNRRFRTSNFLTLNYYRSDQLDSYLCPTLRPHSSAIPYKAHVIYVPIQPKKVL